MAWTDPKTWSVGDVLTAADMNTYVRDNSNFVHQHHGAKVRRGSNQSITDATATKINWDNEVYDDDAWHDNVTNPSRLTVPSGLGGKVSVVFNARFAGNGTGVRQYRPNKNGVDMAEEFEAGNASGNRTLIPWIGEVVAGDYIELEVEQSSGGALNFLGGDELISHVAIAWLGS